MLITKIPFLFIHCSITDVCIACEFIYNPSRTVLPLQIYVNNQGSRPFYFPVARDGVFLSIFFVGHIYVTRTLQRPVGFLPHHFLFGRPKQ